MHEFSFQAMGTDCLIVLDGLDEDGASDAAEAAIAEIERLEQKYSRYRPDSTLSRINRLCGRGEAVEIDAETAFLLDYAGRAWSLSEGAFDVTSGSLRSVWHDGADELSISDGLTRLLPLVGFDKLIRDGRTLRYASLDMEIDLGGLVKEYAADRAAERCRRSGVGSGLVDLGGDIAIVGPRSNGTPWDIALADPAGGSSPIGVLTLSGGGMATSGDYERWVAVGGKRYGHILDARTGRPVEGLASVTVSAETALLAGTLATLAILRGRSGLEWLEARGAFHLAMDAEGTVLGRSVRIPPAREEPGAG